jgi:hypothetical protein
MQDIPWPQTLASQLSVAQAAAQGSTRATPITPWSTTTGATQQTPYRPPGSLLLSGPPISIDLTQDDDEVKALQATKKSGGSWAKCNSNKVDDTAAADHDRNKFHIVSEPEVCSGAEEQDSSNNAANDTNNDTNNTAATTEADDNNNDDDDYKYNADEVDEDDDYTSGDNDDDGADDKVDEVTTACGATSKAHKAISNERHPDNNDFKDNNYVKGTSDDKPKKT